jgi:protease-4
MGLGGGNLALIRIEGVIAFNSAPLLPFGRSGGRAEDTVQYIREAAKSEEVKAILLRIDSPGGSAAAAQEIYQAIMEARTRKKVIASLADVAASGGYYVASACDHVVCNRATLTGSIGVIMDGYSLEKLFEKFGVQPQTVKSGEFKDSGTFDRDMTPRERKLLQAMVDDVYEQFVKDVLVGRRGKIKEAELRAVADGRVLTGEQAYAAHLVDRLGGFQDAVQFAAQEARIPGEPRLIEYGYESPFARWLSSRAPGLPLTPWSRLWQLLYAPLRGAWLVAGEAYPSESDIL